MELIMHNLGENPEPLELYKLTSRNITANMQDLLDAGTVYGVKWALGKDIDSTTGELQEKVYIMTETGSSYATISKSFVRSFKEFVDIVGDKPSLVFHVEKRETKAGRTCIIFVGEGAEYA